jgi:hypothetical protein
MNEHDLKAVREAGVEHLNAVLRLWEFRLDEHEADMIRDILDRATGFCSEQNRMFPEL